MPPGHAPWSAELGGIRLLFGAGISSQIGEAAAALGRRPLLVTDPGVAKNGYAQHLLELLRAAGLDARIFDGVGENPDTEQVEHGTAEARQHSADCLVAVGGGSPMDCAKGINFLLTQGGRMEDYWGDGKARGDMLPSIAVPTTAGTGSEAQRFALISQAGSHRKMACGDRRARFHTVFLDPELLATLPRQVAANTGIDAISHAVESYVTRRGNPISRLYAVESWRLLEGAFEDFLRSPEDHRAAADMLLGAHLAGAAIEVSMLGAAHATANPLTSRYGITHGTAVALTLPHVVRFNGPAAGPMYGELAAAAGLPRDDAVESLARRLEDLRAAAGLPSQLTELGIAEDVFEDLAAEAAQEWTGRFNPRQLEARHLLGLYRAAHRGAAEDD